MVEPSTAIEASITPSGATDATGVRFSLRFPGALQQAFRLPGAHVEAYDSTRSVFLMILLHGWGNTVNSYLVLSSQNEVAQDLYGILPRSPAIIPLRVYGGANLDANHRLWAETARPAVPR